jgi:steroid delta-isomerase-like uncharacterized protein
MSAAANKDLVRRFVEEVLVGGDFAALAELTTCTCIDHAASAGQPGGLAGVARLMIAWRAAFPNLAITVEELAAAGDRVAARWTLSGTHRGAFLGVRPTGRRVAVAGLELYRLAAGRIVERWAVVDLLGLLRQLGAPVPSPAGAAGTGEAEEAGWGWASG